MDEIVEATMIAIEARGQQWSLLRGKKSRGGAVGTRSPRLWWPLSRLEGNDGRCCVGRSRCCESLEGSIDRCSVCHQGGCVLAVARLKRQWLVALSLTDASLKTTVGCGGYDAGDCGRAGGVRRQRAATMAEDEDGSIGLSRDGAGAATTKEGDGSTGALQAEGGDDVRGGRWQH
ncbi:hypothetical protein B296_00014147 [Ensete ventricosum]|uniref:Uncharacterized protein n=1 Tax=Ensete ventricosum TaxID=4639 RepID=A0A426YMT4_ENSVE|nr:hypothetical protein B296_00014147 [Ensete ventricosum]